MLYLIYCAELYTKHPDMSDRRTRMQNRPNIVPSRLCADMNLPEETCVLRNGV